MMDHSKAHRSRWEGFWNSLLRQRFVVMFFALMSFFALMPILEDVREDAWPGTPHMLRLSLFVGSLGAVLISISRTRLSAGIALVMSLATTVLWFVPGPMLSGSWVIFRHAIAIGFISYSIVCILLMVFSSSRVTLNLLCAALCVYLLLGINWAILYSLITTVDPHAFYSNVPGIPPAKAMRIEAGGSMEAIYYSFATLTTLGYGDIVPTSRVSRLFAVFEAVTGQLYLTVLVAQLVGMHIVHKTTRDSPSEM